MRDAPTEEVQAVIDNVNWPETKAPRLQALMRHISEERGELNLDFLRDLPSRGRLSMVEKTGGSWPQNFGMCLTL